MRWNRNTLRSLIFIGIVLLLTGGSLITIHLTVRAAPNGLLPLKGQTVPSLSHASLIHATDTGQSLDISIGLQLHNSTDLDNLISGLYDPTSSHYQQYLIPDQFKQLFAPTDSDVQQVVTYLQSQGMTIDSIASNNLLIDATTTVNQAQTAFHTQINNYQRGSHVFYANATAPTLPASIQPLISSISGLDNSIKYLPHYQRLASRQSHSSHANPASHTALPISYGPKDFIGAYDAAPLQNAGIPGDNQTVALFELDGYQTSDVNTYFQTNNIATPNISNVLVDGVSGAAGSGAIEPELDIEVLGAMAPHANQIVYEGPNSSRGLNDTYNRIVTDNKAQIATTSWGLCENSMGSAELQTMDSIFRQGAAQGISFFAAAGDAGAYDCADTNLAVDSPASDPNVTGVGGTSLQINAGSYGSESVWSDLTAIQHGPMGGGGGGGLSNTFRQPAWQNGPGVANSNSNGYREVPDVTANADPATGYSVFCTVKLAGCPLAGWLNLGGTSGASPLWAGSMALINQYLQAHGKNRIGFSNPALYRLFNTQQAYPAFHDITSGNNLHYQATPNYDMASGMGSPDVYNIARDLGGVAPQQQQLIQNGDFENGPASWQEVSGQGTEIIDTVNAYSGQYSAHLCGYVSCNDSISQSFTVPSSYTSITVQYWIYIATRKPTKLCGDIFTAQLQASNGTVINSLQKLCNGDATSSWTQVTFDVSTALTSYLGQQVTLLFQGNNNFRPRTTDFFIDLVTVTVQ